MLICWTVEVWQICCSTPVLGILLCPIFQKPRNLFQPAKPFLVNQYLKIKKCIRVKLLVWREPLLLRICDCVTMIKQLWSHKVLDFVTAFQVRKLFKTSEKRAPGQKKPYQKHNITLNRGIAYTSHWTTTHIPQVEGIF